MLIYFVAWAAAASIAVKLDVDPITAFFNHDWASVGGWSLFVALSLFIVVGAFREWWTPGARIRRLEKLVADQQDLLKQQSTQISKLTEGNEFTKYVMQQVVPRPQSGGQSSTVAPDTDQGSAG